MRTFSLASVLLLGILLAGCNSSPPADPDPTSGGATTTSAGTTTAPATTSQATSSSAPADYGVELYDNRYDPTTLAVPNYQKVVFTNLGALTHTVTIVKQGDPAGTTYRDQPVQNGATVDFNFPNDGTYTVYCRYHGTETSGMHMTVTV